MHTSTERKKRGKEKDNRQKNNPVDQDTEAIEVPLYACGRFNAHKHTWNMSCTMYLYKHDAIDNKIFTAQVIVLKASYIKKW